MFKKTLTALGMTGALMAGAATFVAADSSPQQFNGGGEIVVGGASADLDGTIRCHGGAHTSHKVIMSDTPLEFTEADGEVSLGKFYFNVTKESQTIQTEYNAETRLYGSADDGHWIELRFYLDGQLMNPNDSVSPLAFANDGEGWESNSSRACARVKRGRHVVEARAVLSDFYNSADLRGWLDDSTFTMDIYN